MQMRCLSEFTRDSKQVTRAAKFLHYHRRAVTAASAKTYDELHFYRANPRRPRFQLRIRNSYLQITLILLIASTLNFDKLIVHDCPLKI